MGCFKCLKFIMFVFNGIIFLAGAAVLGVGVWVKVDSGSLLGFLSGINQAPAELDQVLNVGYLLIAVGTVLLVIGFLGCCGAAKESRCLLMLFFIIVLIVFIAEVAGAIVILVFKPLVSELINTLGKEVVKGIKKGYGTDSDFTSLLNTTMFGLECCGFYGYSDFTDSPFTNSTLQYPVPCCGEVVCDLGVAQEMNVTGCFARIVELIDSNAVVLGGVALGIGALEIAAMIVAMTLYCKIGK